MTVDVVIPVYRPDANFIKLLLKLTEQSIVPGKIIVMNTDASLWRADLIDGLPEETKQLLEVYHIAKAEFDHGKTRKQGGAYSAADIVIFMTDDAIPCDRELIAQLLKPFSDETVGAVYARQLAGENVSLAEDYARRYNYPSEDRKKTVADLKTLGIKTYFCSDVCAAYRKSLFDALGGFVERTIFNEDMMFAARLIKEGYAVYYAASARVIHSHRYSNRQQMKRNFDNAVSQTMYAEVFRGVKSESEGIRFVLRAFSDFIRQGKGLYVFPFLLTCVYKYYGFKMGRKYQTLSRRRILKLTMNPDFFKRLWSDYVGSEK